VKSRFELIALDFDTMLNHHLSQKFKLIGKDEFNHLINILTIIIYMHQTKKPYQFDPSIGHVTKPESY
jgi:hypothetical protein